MTEAKVKKDWYKSWWAILLYIFIGLMIIGGISSNNQTPASSLTSNTINTPANPGEQIKATPPQTQAQTPTCVSNWQCGEWSACSSEGVQTRSCTDSNNCRNTNDMPTLSQTCTPPTNLFRIGETALVGNIAYTVNKVTTASEIGEYYGYGEYENFMGEKADGIFYIVELTVENKGKESVNLFAPTLKIVDDQERTFDYDTTAGIYYKDGDKKAISFGEQLQPGLPISGVEIFDLPKAAKGLKLEVINSGILSSQKAYIDLGI